jgi:chemotaxis protein methyltransferase CheR
VLETAAGLLRARTGLVFTPAREGALEDGLRRAMRRAGVRDASAYVARLSLPGAPLDDLVAEVTVGETHFFRAPEQFAVIGELLHSRFSEVDRPLRIWSAGCASGEEPYSIAIALREMGRLAHASILGTDISRSALARARRAGYGRWALRGVTAAIEAGYFRRDGARLVLISEIRQAVEFRYLNLVEDAYPSVASGAWGMDLILCRNVLIYLDPAAVARVLSRLADSLAPGGWLMLGAADPCGPLEHLPVDSSITTAGLVYRKRDPGTAGVTPGTRGALAVDDRLASPPGTATLPIGGWPAMDMTELRRDGGASAVDHPPPVAPATPAMPDTAGAPADGPAAYSPMAARPASEALRLESAAAAAYAARRYPRAADLARSALEDPRATATSWVLLVRALANLGRIEEAAQACFTALERFPISPELHYLHAVLLVEAQRYAAAVAAARSAVYLEPTLAVGHLALASALLREGASRPAARRALGNAIRLLKTLDPDAPVPAGDGAPAARLLVMAAMQARLLPDAPA